MNEIQWKNILICLAHSPPSECLRQQDIDSIFENMKYVPNNVSGRQTVWEHTLEVVDKMAETTTEPVKLFAALVHDVGKSNTPPELIPHHYGHSERGVKILDSMFIDNSTIKEYHKLAHDVILYHMRIHGILEIRQPFKLYGLVAIPYKSGINSN